MIKVKLKRFLAITMALSMVISTNAFATPINLTDTPADASKTDTLDKTNGTDYFADEDTNNWSNGQITEEVRVNVDRASFFDITIPKEIVLNGNDGSATYEVSITGELAGDQVLVVKPDDSFQLTEDGGKTTPVTVEQDKDTFNYQDIDNSVKGNGTLSASEISAGNWSGKFNFNIEFKDNNNKIHIHNADKTTKATKSWELVSGDFSQNGDMWTSTNKTYGTTGTATWTITLDQDAEISIPYDLIIDHSFPFFTVELDGIEIINYGNDFPGTYITTLSQGTHTITAEFENYANRPDITNTENNSEAQLTLNDVYYIVYSCSEDEHVHELITEITKEATSTEEGIKTIKCKNCDCVINTETIPITFNNLSWAEIAAISEAGNAASIFSIGDEKELTIGSETYHVQILGFAHDDKSDGTGKAGITVGLKEVMTTTHNMNSSGNNAGGWENSEMRTYLNETVHNNLPQEVKDIIKPVNKKTSEGNASSNITTTSDKLFLLSEVEIFGSTTYSASGEGSQYQYFTDGGSKIKYKAGSSYGYSWRERSPRVSSTNHFCHVNDNGYANYSSASNASGVVFGFSI